MSPASDLPETVVRLDKAEQDKLSEANRLLTELTDVQDGPGVLDHALAE
jgi:hypothetical protein